MSDRAVVNSCSLVCIRGYLPAFQPKIQNSRRRRSSCSFLCTCRAIALERRRIRGSIRGFSDGSDKHPVGGEHEAKEEQGKNDRPGKPGGGEGDTQESRQYHGREPKNAVPLQQIFLFGVFHKCVGCCWFGSLETCENPRLRQSCEVDHELVNSIGPDRHCLLDTFGEEDDGSRSSPSLTYSRDHFYRLGGQA